jgi:hypothetical protein
MHHADLAMYQAKAADRSGLRFFEATPERRFGLSHRHYRDETAVPNYSCNTVSQATVCKALGLLAVEASGV